MDVSNFEHDPTSVRLSRLLLFWASLTRTVPNAVGLLRLTLRCHGGRFGRDTVPPGAQSNGKNERQKLS